MMVFIFWLLGACLPVNWGGVGSNGVSMDIWNAVKCKMAGRQQQARERGHTPCALIGRGLFDLVGGCHSLPSAITAVNTCLQTPQGGCGSRVWPPRAAAGGTGGGEGSRAASRAEKSILGRVAETETSSDSDVWRADPSVTDGGKGRSFFFFPCSRLRIGAWNRSIEFVSS